MLLFFTRSSQALRICSAYMQSSSRSNVYHMKDTMPQYNTYLQQLSAHRLNEEPDTITGT